MPPLTDRLQTGTEAVKFMSKLFRHIIGIAILLAISLAPVHAEAQLNWRQLDSGTTEPLWGIWGAPGSSTFAVGDAGVVRRSFGLNFTESPTGVADNLCDVWGNALSDVFAVGLAGTIIHFDGTAWSSMASGTSADLFGVWSVGVNDVYAVGAMGTVRHYDGDAWNGVDVGAINGLYAIWGSSASDIYVVGAGGISWHFDGTTWTGTNVGTSENLSGVWGSAADDVYVAGDNGTLFHFDGMVWGPVPLPVQSNHTSGSLPAAPNLYTVWGTGSDDVVVMGAGGVILHYDGTWRFVESPVGFDLYRIWGTGPENIFAVGEGGAIIYFGPDDPVPVLITRFQAEAKENGVELRWDVYADETIAGFEVIRAEVLYAHDDEHGQSLPLFDGLLARASRRFFDSSVRFGATYSYTLIAHGQDTGSIRSQTIRVTVGHAGFELLQNHPNPFNPETAIRFSLPRDEVATLRIFDVSGALVRTLFNEATTSGSHLVRWNGRDNRGRAVGSGFYFYQLRAGNRIRTEKMTLLK